MRDILRKFDWHTYGLGCSDLDYVIGIIDKILAEREWLHKERMNEYTDHEEAVEIISDLSHYQYEENQLLNHFLLWRIQGIFEGILKQTYFPNNNLMGLKAKIEHVRSAGGDISDEDFKNLLEWGYLRNALSHFPPERYRSGPLARDDIEEYVQLIRGILNKLRLCK